MKYSHIIVPGVMIGLLLSIGQAQAAPYKPMAHKQKKPANNYAGASVGSADDGSGWKVYSGVRLNDSIIIEGGYVSFGEASMTDNNGNRITSAISGYTTAGVATYQYSDQIELFGKAGMLWWDNEISGSSSQPSTDGSNTFVGIGANYDMGDNLGLKAEWERFKGIQRFQNSADTMDLLSVGVTFSSL